MSTKRNYRLKRGQEKAEIWEREIVDVKIKIKIKNKFH